jgi:hypothetical protein
MNNFLKVIIVAFISASASAVAMDEMKMGMKMDVKMMDTNGDGAISKDEFMRHHEMMYEKMKKNKTGTVDVKDMSMMMSPHDMNMTGKGKPKDSAKSTDGMSK